MFTGAIPEQIKYARECDWWSAQIHKADVQGFLLQVLLNSTVEQAETGFTVTLQQVYKQMLQEHVKEQLAIVLRQMLGTDAVDYVFAEPGITPLSIQQRIDAARIEQAKAYLQQQEDVNAFVNALDLQLIESSIQLKP